MVLAATRDVLRRNNVVVSGNPEGRPLVFAHGFGCSQAAWDLVAPQFEEQYRVILFDHVGAGDSDLTAYDRGKYDSLHGYSRRRPRDPRRFAAGGRRLHRSLRQRDDRGARREPRPVAIRCADPGRSVAALRQRRRLPRRLRARRHRRAAGCAGCELPGLVGGHCPDDHGQSRSAGTGRSADRKLLQHGPEYRPPLRARHLPLRQPIRPR